MMQEYPRYSKGKVTKECKDLNHLNNEVNLCNHQIFLNITSAISFFYYFQQSDMIVILDS